MYKQLIIICHLFLEDITYIHDSLRLLKKWKRSVFRDMADLTNHALPHKSMCLQPYRSADGSSVEMLKSSRFYCIELIWCSKIKLFFSKNLKKAWFVFGFFSFFLF
jgi:hypothetical protein